MHDQVNVSFADQKRIYNVIMDDDLTRICKIKKHFLELLHPLILCLSLNS